MKRFARLTTAFLAAALALPAAAHADTLTFIRDGNVWISHPNGDDQRQLTTGGGWEQPTQADDGTIVAKHGGALVRMTPTGQTIGSPFTPEARTAVFDPEVSPDGQKVAYWDLKRVGDPGCAIATSSGCKRVLVASVSGATLHSGMDGIYHPTWIDNGRLLVFNDSSTTFVKRLGATGVPDSWFFLDGKRMTQGDYSPGAARLANIDDASADTMWLYNVPGDPPAAPTIVCHLIGVPGGHLANPAWFKQKHNLVFEDEEGIWLRTSVGVSEQSPCGFGSTTPTIPGASDPELGPADLPPRPSPPIETPATDPPPAAATTAQPQSAPAPATSSPESAPGGALRFALRRGIPFNVKCRRACSVRVTLSVDRATARRAGLGAKRRVAVGSGRARRSRRGRVTVVARFTRTARAKLARLGSVAVAARIDVREGRRLVRSTRRLELGDD